jgi:glycosyltransferase involved in cell wall biosynthesis
MEAFAKTLEELKSTGKLDRKLFLYAENAYLAGHLSQLWNTRVRPLPIPASPPPPNAGAAARAALTEKLDLSDDSFIIISLGSARLEKGFHRIPEIAEEVFARVSSLDGAEGNIRFVLHASTQIIGRDPQIAKALDALAARHETEVTLMLEPLSDDDYQALLHASDVVLLPYGEQEYRVRGSAVVTEALAAGKTILAAANTYPGKAAEEHGGLTANTAADFAEAILTAYRERSQFREKAARESETFIAANSMETYWPRCLAAEQEAEPG